MRTDLQRERHVALYMLVAAEKAADEREGHAGLQHAQRAPLRTYENRDRRAEAQPAKNDGNLWDNACRTFRQPQLRHGSGANEARNLKPEGTVATDEKFGRHAAIPPPPGRRRLSRVARR